MRIFFSLFFTILFSLWNSITAQVYFDFNEEIKSAYLDASSLKIKQSKQKTDNLKRTEPNNAMIAYIENYQDFFTLFIQEDATQYKKLIKNRSIRLNIIKSGDQNSPYYLFCQAEVLLQWATVRLKFNENFSAAKDVYEANKLLEKNKKLFPDFAENNKSLSIIHALAESVPSWVRKIVGIKGSIALGTKEIRKLADDATRNETVYKAEIIAIYAYILFYLNNNKEEAYKLFDRYKMDHRNNPLICFLKATITQKTGRNDEAIRVLLERPMGPEYLDFYYLDFMLGKFKLYRLDRDANKHILHFLSNFKGRHYVKEAYQKLAWYDWVIQNDTLSYHKNILFCQTKGNKLIDEDIQAHKESAVKVLPDNNLLKARLLYDGGYYKKAFELLQPLSKYYVKGLNDGEYYYRMGRISDALKNYFDAINYYRQTIAKGDPAKYYPCSSALYLGLIYENQNNITAAKNNFNLCLSLSPEGYSSSLHQKAKAGLDRLKGK